MRELWWKSKVRESKIKCSFEKSTVALENEYILRQWCNEVEQ